MFALVHHPDYIIGSAGGARFPWDKYAAVAALVRAGDPTPQEHAPDLMPRAWIEAVHDPDYVAAVFASSLSPDQSRRIGFPVTEALARRVRRTTGGTWLAGRLALEQGFAANSAGGSHHALYDGGAGYCVFNDLAIAANRLLAEGDAGHILIADLDVHQGDGTAALLAGRSDVTTFSMHAARNFPVRKARSTLDVALPDGCGDDAYLTLLEEHLDRIVAESRPDLIFYQAGVDCHADDKLGRLGLSDEGLACRDAMVAHAARARGVPLASVLGGGYADDPLAVARRHAQSIRVLAGCMHH